MATTAGRRDGVKRQEAEAAAEARYVEDLRTSAKMLETTRKPRGEDTIVGDQEEKS